MAPEHRRLSRYDTMEWQDIAALDVGSLMAEQSHCYLWVPNALLQEGLATLDAWGFTYKAMLVWAKRRKDGGPDGRGVGFYFRNTTEPILFGVRGKLRTLAPARRQVNIIETRQAGALPQTGRAVRHHRSVLARSVPRDVRSLPATGLDRLG